MAKYSHDTHIATEDDVRSFFRYIVYDLGINFHPDDDFQDYVYYDNDKLSMDEEQVHLYNRLIDEAFDVCGENVYEICSELMKEKLHVEQNEKEESNG